VCLRRSFPFDFKHGAKKYKVQFIGKYYKKIYLNVNRVPIIHYENALKLYLVYVKYVENIIIS
jgi:hypothetical protein